MELLTKAENFALVKRIVDPLRFEISPEGRSLLSATTK
jgi:hypothetical protein